MKLTVKIKLDTDKDSYNHLLHTMKEFNSVCQIISNYAFAHDCFNKRSLQSILYHKIRSESSIPSQLLIRAFAKVSDSYRVQLSLFNARKRSNLVCCNFCSTGCVVYDSRLLSYGIDCVRLRCWHGRVDIPIFYPPGLDRSVIRGEADLVFIDNVFYLYQTVCIAESEMVLVDDFIGVDLGLVNIAYDSEGGIYNNKKIKLHRECYQSLRSSLKKKKTKNSRRRLKRLSCRSSRFSRDINHCISKSLVQKAKAMSRGIAMERLVNFFDKTKVRRKDRLYRCSWSFRELRDFVDYKCKLNGIPFVLVDSAYSSQECSECHNIDHRNRKNQSDFSCIRCGYSCNADFNASKNIKNRAVVNQLEIYSKRGIGGEAATKSSH